MLPALTHLAAAGRVGYDAAENAYYTRELPWDRMLLEAMHPRLADARSLVADGAVDVAGNPAIVTSNGGEHLVRRVDDGLVCTCPW